MSTEGDEGPSVSAAEPGGVELGGGGGLGAGRGSSRKAAAAGATKYTERSINSRSVDDSDSVVDENQPALGASSLSPVTLHNIFVQLAA